MREFAEQLKVWSKSDTEYMMRQPEGPPVEAGVFDLPEYGHRKDPIHFHFDLPARQEYKELSVGPESFAVDKGHVSLVLKSNPQKPIITTYASSQSMPELPFPYSSQLP